MKARGDMNTYKLSFSEMVSTIRYKDGRNTLKKLEKEIEKAKRLCCWKNQQDLKRKITP